MNETNAPSWVDLQVNGYAGVDFSSPALTVDAFARAARAVIDAGTGVFLPTLITSPPDLYERNMAVIEEAVKRHNLQPHIPGVHWEGPFISSEPGAVGCHNPAHVLPPDVSVLDRFSFIRMITVAADRPGVTDFIRQAAARGVVVALGHQMATYEQLCVAAEAGATCLTHFGNGIPNMIPRHKNPLWSGLACDALSTMLITDGHHLPPEVIKTVLRVKTAANVIVTSDSSSPAGCPPGVYNVFGDQAVLEPDGKLHNPSKGCLCGSAATMAACMTHLSSLNLLTAAELRQVGYENARRLLKQQPRTTSHPPQGTANAVVQ